jgi:hypothetical protein
VENNMEGTVDAYFKALFWYSLTEMKINHKKKSVGEPVFRL